MDACAVTNDADTALMRGTKEIRRIAVWEKQSSGAPRKMDRIQGYTVDRQTPYNPLIGKVMLESDKKTYDVSLNTLHSEEIDAKELCFDYRHDAVFDYTACATLPTPSADDDTAQYNIHRVAVPHVPPAVLID